MKELTYKSLYSDIYEILDNRSFIKETKTIYHYTSLECLYKILNSRSFHCCHCAFTNDYSEFEFGIDAFQKEILKHAPDDDERKSINTILNLVRESKNSGSVFIGSFTSLKDSLSQWRSYAHNATGVAIGFNVEELNIYCEKNELFFGNVIYSDDFDQLFRNFVKKIGPILTPLINDNTPPKIKEGNILLAGYLLASACFIKHFGYREESEVRIVTGKGPNVQNKLSNGLYVPYCEIKFEDGFSEIINEIWIGPAANQRLIERSAKLMLREKNLIEKCKVELSTIPFRLIAQRDSNI